jgi:hypothetical protein
MFLSLGHETKDPPFGGGSCISFYLFKLYAPPPFEEDIIMTTTIIIEGMTAITL